MLSFLLLVKTKVRISKTKLLKFIAFVKMAQNAYVSLAGFFSLAR